MTTQEAKDALWSAYLAEPKPVTTERAKELGAAMAQAAGASSKSFLAWFEQNAAALMARINGTAG